MEVQLKPLTRENIELLRRWRNENREYFVTQDIITSDMQNNWFENIYSKNVDDTIYVVYSGDKPVGTLAMIKRGDDYEMGRVMLGEKKHKRKGVMGQATEQLLSEFSTEDESQRVFLEVLKGNEPAINFYKKHGFVECGENETELIMERYV